MPTHQAIPESKVERRLRKRLEHFRWSVSELEWLLAPPRQYAPSLESLILIKLEAARFAEKEAADGEAL